MQKKLLMLIIIACLVVGLCGCTSTSANNSDSSSGISSVLSGSLTGADLLNSVSLSEPYQYKKTSECYDTGSEPQTYTVYCKGNKVRSEMPGPGQTGKNIMITDGDEGMIFSFTEGQTTGKSTTMKKVGMDGVVSRLDSYPKNWGEAVENLPSDFIARVENLNGEKVIYVESTKINDQNKSWLSMVYPIILKTESYSDGSLIAKTEVTELTTADLSDDLFIVPSNISFTDSGIR